MLDALGAVAPAVMLRYVGLNRIFGASNNSMCYMWSRVVT